MAQTIALALSSVGGNPVILCLLVPELQLSSILENENLLLPMSFPSPQTGSAFGTRKEGGSLWGRKGEKEEGQENK